MAARVRAAEGPVPSANGDPPQHELRHQHTRQQVRAGEAARDRVGRRRRLGDALAVLRRADTLHGPLRTLSNHQIWESNKLSAALSFAESIAILAQHGVLEHLNKMSWSAPVVAVVAPQDYEVMAAYLTNIDVIDSRDLRDDISESMIILDCAKCDVLQNVSLELRTKNVVLSIFTDGIALYQCKCLDYLPKYSEGKKFFLITSPRSGSTFICDMLTSAGVFGSPTEHLKAWVAEALVAANANFSDFIDALHKASATSNGVFGSKVIIDDLFTFLPRFSDAIFETLRGATVFFLTRADKSAQAMSAVRADVLSLYHVHTGEEAPSTPRPRF